MGSEPVGRKARIASCSHQWNRKDDGSRSTDSRVQGGGSSLAVEIGEPRGWPSAGHLGAIAGAKQGHCQGLRSTDGFRQRLARGVPRGSGPSPFAVERLPVGRKLGWNISLYCHLHHARTHLPSRCIGLSGLGARARTACDRSWLNCSSRVTVSMTACCLSCMWWKFSSLRWSRVLRSNKVCSMLFTLGSGPSCIGGIGSAGVPGCDGGGFALLYSRCTRAWREARRLISLNPTRSPRLKFPFPCLNSHRVESGVPW